MKNKYSLSIIGILLILAMLCSFLALPVSAAAEAEAAALAKIDPALLEKMETASPDEKIPVAIWYTDIDQDNVDKLTVDKVGFTQDDIALTYEMPSTKLISDLEKGEDGAADEMQAYLKRTEAKREKERKRTNEYIMTRREFSREKYNDKSDKVVKDISINEKDIVFKSQYAPMIIANLTVKEIKTYCKNIDVTSIYYQCLNDSIMDSGIFYHIGVAKDTISYNDVVENISTTDNPLDGSGIVIGVSDGGAPQEHEELVNASITKLVSTESEHATNVTRIIVGETSGFAKGASVVCTNSSKASIEELLDPEYNVSIINTSFSTGSFNDSSNCRWYDHIISQHSVTVVASACNTEASRRVYAPGLSYNAIMVGAYHLGASSSVYNSTLTDDTVTSQSGYVNTGYAEKPDVMMPGNSTSYATPILTSCIALMLQVKPSLATYPQAIKAIVLASCHRKALPAREGEAESIYDGITEHQGAGAPDFWTMMCILCQGTYGVGRISAAKNQATRRFVMPKYYSDTMNVSLTWIREGSANDTDTDVSSYSNVNLDLYVYRNGQEVGSSTIGTTDTKKSSTEMAYFELDNTSRDYEIRINDVDSYNGIIRYGYAYSTDNPYMTPATEEGIYYIRNYASDKYLTLNTSTNETFMSNFTGANNQQWVLRGTENDYEIYPAHRFSSEKINFGAQVGSNPYYKSVLGTNDLNLTLKSWETDTTLEPDAYVFTSTSGGSNNIMSYTSTTGIFVRSATESVINMYRMWVLEDINYQNGDVDMNGSITEDDITPIQEYLSHTAVLSNVQEYLSDANYDGRISVQDITYINKMIKGLL
ncbi:MAG: S8 family serine peptidase [Ruminococcus sp.]|nr:S8 family serine peptidase [Ruminococcus sp.]